MSSPLSDLREAVVAASGAIAGSGGATCAAPTLERPRKAGFGDYATNAAMLLAPARGEAPRDVAELLREELDGRLGSTAERIEVAGPGFINLFLADRWYREGVGAVLAAGDGFGGDVMAVSERIQVEFVSANPTGPLVIVNARSAAVGDSLGRLLRGQGADVVAEYYINDAGTQFEA
ncbi:MAG: arginine--tRNA ligase, partial [Solirubrobacteraceae bacterium]